MVTLPHQYVIQDSINSPPPEHALLKLSKDDLGEILNCLQGKEILEFAFTCRIYFNFVKEWAKLKYPFAIAQNGEERKILIGYEQINSNLTTSVIDRESGVVKVVKNKKFKPKPQPIYKILREENPAVWTLVRALECHECLWIDEDNHNAVLQVFDEIAQNHGGNLDLISPIFKFFSYNLQTDRRITDIFISNCSPVTLPHVKIERLYEKQDSLNLNDKRKRKKIFKKKLKLFPNGLNGESRQIIEKTIRSIPVTFNIKKLWFDDENDAELRLFQFLSNCLSLEELVIDLSDNDVYYEGKEFFECPVLNSLKHLEITSHYSSSFDYDHQFIVDLLKLTPNLEEFYCQFHAYEYYNNMPATICGQDFLKYLTKMCPNLKEVHLGCSESERSLEISDQALYEFLKSQPKLEFIHTDSCQITGEIFSKIGEFSRLEHIGIMRRHINDDKDEYNNAPKTPQYDKLSFGGGILKNLKKILIGKEYNFSEEEKQDICESLYKIAPNIDKSVNIFDCDSSEDEDDEE